MPENSRRSYSPRRSSSSHGIKQEEGSSTSKRESTTPNKKDGHNNNRRSYSNSYSGNKKERKFTGRCRLFVGNLGDCGEDEMKEMFSKYGEVAEVFVNKDKGFGFIRLDTRLNAEAAKTNLDLTQRKGKTIRVRFATHAAAIQVHELGPYVTNEVLEKGFGQFGDVERAVVVCDDRGKSKNYGVVEFARKSSAVAAMNKSKDNLFLLGRAPKPILVKSYEQEDDEDGLPAKNLERNPGYQKETEVPPHFARPGTFEFEWAQRWKSLEEMEQTRREALNQQFKEAREKLESEMQHAIKDHEAMLMRQAELQQKQEEMRRYEEQQHREEMRRQERMQHEMEMRRREEERRYQDEMRMQEEARHREEMMFRQRQEEFRRRQDDMMRSEHMGPMPFPPRGMPPRGPPRGDWGPGPGMGSMGMGPGPGMGPPAMNGPRGPGPMGPGPGPMPMRPGRFDSDMDRKRERADRDRLAARSRDHDKRRKF